MCKDSLWDVRWYINKTALLPTRLTICLAPASFQLALLSENNLIQSKISISPICDHLQVVNDSLGVLVRLGPAAQVTRQSLALGQRGENGIFDLVCVVIQAHMTQHHDTAEKQGSGIGETLACNIGS